MAGRKWLTLIETITKLINLIHTAKVSTIPPHTSTFRCESEMRGYGIDQRGYVIGEHRTHVETYLNSYFLSNNCFK